MSILNFRANAKVENLVGRDLITNNIVAVFELVKNSYDAGATEVHITFNNLMYDGEKGNTRISDENTSIEIKDNGCGMSLEEIKKYWMELGTPHKEKKRTVRPRKNEVEIISKRIVNGEKGIGRFGVDKIASKLILSSVDDVNFEKTTVYFDWNRFNDRTKMLEEIPCEYHVDASLKYEESGTVLLLENLRDDWVHKDLLYLEKSLSKFLTPNYEKNDSFKIYMHLNYVEDTSDLNTIIEVKNDTFEYLKTKIVAELNEQGSLQFEILEEGKSKEKASINNFYDFNNLIATPIGNIKFEIYYLDAADKRVFTKKMGLRTSDYGNIKIFRENFRVMPYGEPNNDWLEIDKKHAQGIFRSFGTRDLVGYVILDNQEDLKRKVLKEATDRMGLIEDANEFRALKSITWYLIDLLQKFVFLKIKQKTHDEVNTINIESQNIKDETKVMLDSFQNILTNPPNTSKLKEKAVRDFEKQSNSLISKVQSIEIANKKIENKIKIYNQITQKESILFDMLHSIKNKIVIIESTLSLFKHQIKGFSNEQDETIKNELNEQIEVLDIVHQDILKLIDGALTKVNMTKLSKDKIEIISLINEVLKFHTRVFSIENIECNIESSLLEAYCFASDSAMKNVFENLISNSIKALKQNDKNNKKIIVFIKYSEGDKRIEIIISDNGIGIPASKESAVFTLWNSTTGGTGIGLISSKEIIEDHNGELNFVKINDSRVNTSFLINLPVEKVVKKEL